MYFLTLMIGGSDKEQHARCVGWWPNRLEFLPLTGFDTEGGYYTHAVQERVDTGLHPVSTVIDWWEWSDLKMRWVKVPTPEWAKKIVNWAIG